MRTGYATPFVERLSPARSLEKTMARKRSRKQARASNDAYIDPFRVDDPEAFRLSAHKTAERGDLDKDRGQKIVEANAKRLSDLQDRLYAENRWSVLVIFQGLDAAGKDSAVEHVMSGVNPQGCEVHSFKVPTPDELGHDFLWRSTLRLPPRGRIGIFNRSYYEELLVVRVHPEILAKQRLPAKLVTRNIWRERFEDISAYERYLTRNGTVVLKFFLHISREEQRQRFLERLEIPSKRWKFSMGDIAERALWNRYQAAYQDLIRHTSTRHAPWHVVPADHKWFARVVIGSTLVRALEQIDPHFPRVDPGSLNEFDQVRKALEAETRKANAKRNAR
jgi:PPK2 family polyphosphate:nucleotide phosphotransferase